MFDIGFWELALIAIIALLVLGPERLPGAARTAGRLIARAKRVVGNLRSEIERELDLSELNELRRQAELSELKELADETQTTVSEVVKDVVAEPESKETSTTPTGSKTDTHAGSESR